MDKITQIINYFDNIDLEKKEKNVYVKTTAKGIFGVSNLENVNNFLKQLKPNKNDVFIDLGSGDGRVNILASLYCDSIGIEFDKDLVVESNKHNKELNTSATFLEQDYESFDYSKANILFSFADHFFTPEFIEKLKKEFKGTLYIYQGIFTPDNITKGRTIWINQTPIISYLFE